MIDARPAVPTEYRWACVIDSWCNKKDAPTKHAAEKREGLGRYSLAEKMRRTICSGINVSNGDYEFLDIHVRERERAREGRAQQEHILH